VVRCRPCFSALVLFVVEPLCGDECAEEYGGLQDQVVGYSRLRKKVEGCVGEAAMDVTYLVVLPFGSVAGQGEVVREDRSVYLNPNLFPQSHQCGILLAGST